MSVRREFRAYLTWMAVLGISAGMHRFADRFKLLDLTPISIFDLEAYDWLALAMTFSASLVGWLTGILLGYVSGMVVATITVEQLNFGELRSLASTFDHLFDAVWIVPLVITLSLAGSATLYLETHTSISRALTGLGLIVVCGFVLGGYGIYKSIYTATTHAKKEVRALMRSIYCRPRGLGAHLGQFGERLRLVKSLRDAEIRSFADALLRALHLSIVAIMILEIVKPNFYEHFFPSGGVVRSWTGGAGWNVLMAQNDYLFGKMAGVLWTVLLFDFLAVRALEALIDVRWLKYDTRRI